MYCVTRRCYRLFLTKSSEHTADYRSMFVKFNGFWFDTKVVNVLVIRRSGAVTWLRHLSSRRVFRFCIATRTR